MGKIAEAREKLSPKWTRKFLGKIEGFKDKQEQRFEQKHLKAYIKGHAQFKYGKNPKTNEDIWHPVQQLVQDINKEKPNNNGN